MKWDIARQLQTRALRVQDMQPPSSATACQGKHVPPQLGVLLLRVPGNQAAG